MRRSKRIATLTLGSACLLVLASCGEDNPPDVYGSVDECIAKTGDRTSCDQELAAAQKQHEETAPKYEQKASCEEIYGQGKCVPAQSASGGGSWFMPAMMGFMAGRMMGGMSQPVYYDRRGYAFAGGQPWQERRDSVARSSGGYSRTGTTGTTAGSSPSGSVSRGGFGATGSALSSGS